MTFGNGHRGAPLDVIELHFPPFDELPPRRFFRARRGPLWPHVVLFLLTVLSTLAVGSEFAQSYAQNREPFSGDQNPLALMLVPFAHPRLLVLGIPFSFTLLLILFAHEMGHYFACKRYGIDASYPYFIPAPTLFGTFGAVIRIRSPITTRRALFDVGLAGPVVGFLLAVPAMVFGVAAAKIVPGVQEHALILFGDLPLLRILIAALHPGVDPASVLLHPVGRAAWVGLFVTALNLLPAWQLDGGHILFSLTSRNHRRISLGVAVVLLVLGRYAWAGWYVWGTLLLVLSLRFRHPPLVDRWEPLGRARRVWALAALAMFLLCFILAPAISP